MKNKDHLVGQLTKVIPEMVIPEFSVSPRDGELVIPGFSASPRDGELVIPGFSAPPRDGDPGVKLEDSR